MKFWVIFPSIYGVLALSAVQAAGQQIPEWFSRPAPLTAPVGSVFRVSTMEQILKGAEELAPNATLMIEPGVYKLSRPLVLRGRTNVVIRSVSGDPSSVTLTRKGWDEGPRDDILHISDCDGV